MRYLHYIKRVSRYLAENTGLPPDKEPILSYAVEVLFTSLLNIISIILLGLLFSVLPSTISCLITGFLLRHTAGGAHSKSPWRCAAITITVYPLMAILASYLAHKQPYSDIMTILVITAGLITFIKLAPVDTETAPILSLLRRKRLKLMSIIFLSILSLTILGIRWINWTYALDIQVSIVFTILWVSFMLTSYGNRLLLFIDRISFKKKCK